MYSCVLYASSASPHVAQVYTGYSMLSRKGLICLRQKLTPPRIIERVFDDGCKPETFAGVFARINGKAMIFYDMHDSSRINKSALDIADAYFKRSYVPSAIPAWAMSKVYPLGFNYEVYVGKWDIYEIRRILSHNIRARRLRSIFRSVAELGGLVFRPTVEIMCSPPNYACQPKVLFMVRAWDPDSDPVGLPIELKEERSHINAMRAECIRLLKKEFGGLFGGGFVRSTYAMKRYPDLVLDSIELSAKESYIQLLRQYPICIASAGLHGSIGWKMGEYVAFSKAIVSERFEHCVPGCFENGVNFLAWDTPEDCLAKAVLLFKDRQAREGMMESNWKYYQEYLSPEQLILRTIKIALGETKV